MTTMDIPDHRPQVPSRPLGIGLLGCGWIAQDAHLPGYLGHGFPVAGIYDISPEAMAAAKDRHGVHCYASAEELLADPAVEVVDIPARTEDRFPLVKQAIAAGKHVLSQKPFANDLAEAQEIVDLADRAGVVVAVNQNGRWSPAWRLATLWHQAGAIGDVTAVSHTFETSFAWTESRHFNDQKHFVIYDYAAHWFDITRCWLAGKSVSEVRAWDGRAVGQPDGALTPWNMFAEIRCTDGTTATILGNGGATGGVAPRHTFSIIGTLGTIRGLDLDADRVDLLRDDGRVRVSPTGSWFPDGFAGTMGELQVAIEQQREPFNSGRHVVGSLRLGLAAVESAENGGAAVTLDLDL